MVTKIVQCYYSKNWQCYLSCDQWTVPRWSSHHQILFSGWFPCQLRDQLFASQWVVLQGHLIFGSATACSFRYACFLVGKWLLFLHSFKPPFSFSTWKTAFFGRSLFSNFLLREVLHWGIFLYFHLVLSF